MALDRSEFLVDLDGKTLGIKTPTYSLETFVCTERELEMQSGFKAPALQLAVLDEIKGGDDWLESVESAYKKKQKTRPSWPAWEDVEENDSENLSGLQEFLLEIPLSPKQLSSVKALVLDGGRDVYGWIFPFWHDSDMFQIDNLGGIEQCQGLEELDLGQGLVQRCSLSPLIELPKLKRLSLCVNADHTEIGDVLKIPNLKELSVFNDHQTHTDWPRWREIQKQVESLGKAQPVPVPRKKK